MELNTSPKYSISSTCQNGIHRCITYWLAVEDKYRSFNPDKHISLEEVYERILHELATMDDRFYAYIDQLNPYGSDTNVDESAFAIYELMKMLNIIYKTPNYAAISDDQWVINDDFGKFAKASTGSQLYWKKCEKLRKHCATRVWRLWNYERLWSQRCGLIHIFIAENSVPKVLLVAHIRKGIYYYGYPKGKCNVGEIMIMAMFREFTEEVNKDTFDFYTYTDEGDLEIIKKSPSIGRRRKGRSRDHHYAVIKSSVEYTDYRHQKYEISNVEWYPVLRLPCCQKCQICSKRKLLGDSEEGLPIDYHMVTLRDIHNQNSAVLDLLKYIESHGDPTIFSSYFHAHRRCGHDLA